MVDAQFKFYHFSFRKLIFRTSRELQLDFISSNWRSLVVEEIDKTEVLLSQQLEICIFSTVINLHFLNSSD